MPRGILLERVLLPVANEEDARITAERLHPYDPGHVVGLHVVEKAGGGMDKTPVSFSEEVAERSFEAVRAVFPNAESRTTYATNVVENILDTAGDVEATAIAFRSRGGHRLLQFIAGDRTLKLISRARVPVIVLPDQSGESD